MAIIDTSRQNSDEPMIIGYAKFGEPIDLIDPETFEQYRDQTRIYEGDDYDLKDTDKAKWGYPVEGVMKIEPRPLPEGTRMNNRNKFFENVQDEMVNGDAGFSFNRINNNNDLGYNFFESGKEIVGEPNSGYDDLPGREKTQLLKSVFDKNSRDNAKGQMHRLIQGYTENHYFVFDNLSSTVKVVIPIDGNEHFIDRCEVLYGKNEYGKTGQSYNDSDKQRNPKRSGDYYSFDASNGRKVRTNGRLDQFESGSNAGRYNGRSIENQTKVTEQPLDLQNFSSRDYDRYMEALYYGDTEKAQQILEGEYGYDDSWGEENFSYVPLNAPKGYTREQRAKTLDWGRDLLERQSKQTMYEQMFETQRATDKMQKQIDRLIEQRDRISQKNKDDRAKFETKICNYTVNKRLVLLWFCFLSCSICLINSRNVAKKDFYYFGRH